MNADQAAKDFMDALHKLEETGDPEVMQDRFADECELHALVHRRDHSGRDGVTSFWTEYLKPFSKIHSEFTHHSAGGDLAVLEWVGKGTLKEGGGDRPVEYDGCSILELDGEGKVTRFRTFYDSAQFVTADGK